MKSLSAMVALLISVSASAGELDGKGLKCMPPNKEPQMFFFADNQVVWRWIDVEGYEAQVWERGKDREYELSPSTISFNFGGDNYFVLDRATLELRARDVNGRNTRWWQCEVYQSLEEVWEMLNQYKRNKQKAIDEEMKDNKI